MINDFEFVFITFADKNKFSFENILIVKEEGSSVNKLFQIKLENLNKCLTLSEISFSLINSSIFTVIISLLHTLIHSSVKYNFEDESVITLNVTVYSL